MTWGFVVFSSYSVILGHKSCSDGNKTRYKVRTIIGLDKETTCGKIKQYKSALDDDFIEEKAEKELSDLQSFLLEGPVMDPSQYAQHLQDRIHINKWRMK